MDDEQSAAFRRTLAVEHFVCWMGYAAPLSSSSSRRMASSSHSFSISASLRVSRLANNLRAR